MTSKHIEGEDGVDEDVEHTGVVQNDVQSLRSPTLESEAIFNPRPNGHSIETDLRHADDTNERPVNIAEDLLRTKTTPFGDTPSPGLPELAPTATVQRYESVEGSVSTPDDTPSIQESIQSSPGNSLPISRQSARSFSSPQPFDRRFQARVSSSPLASPKSLSPAFLTHRSRQSSISSQLTHNLQEQEEEEQSPWEVVRWTKLKRISAQVFSESGRRAFGRPTFFTVAAYIIIGTSKGIILVFDYQQRLKSIIGQGTKAAETGNVTSLAISADHSTVASGHADGSIFTWDLAYPARPFLHIQPLTAADLKDRKVDGHVASFSVLHVGFLGSRHTAIVSADNSGMAFSHVAKRGLGIVGRSVKTTRILGRYPETPTASTPRKPSSVLALASAPLGNVEQAIDDLGLTALLTPYLLVVVSTTPIAQTQFKTPRAKEVAPHGALSGCLAWFPAVKLRYSGNSGQTNSKAKLVYCWSNVLTVLDIEVTLKEDSNESEKGPSLNFKPRSRWKSEEAIVAVQWISRSVIALMTVSQKLVILEDNVMRVADTSDLIPKHIYRQDLYSRQLQPLVDQLENDVSMHGVIADAFHMSFRAYKGRLFILGISDVSMGTLSNWADRLLTLMETGDFIAGIQLATAYYNGTTDRLTVGLPEEDDERHSMVEERLLEMMSASLRFTFKDIEPGNVDVERKDHLRDLVTECFTASISAQDFDFLFNEVYECYSNASVAGLFFDLLEEHILDDKIATIPPGVLQDLMNHYASQDRANRLENMILHLQTLTMDIDQVTTMCKSYKLYDALIYVWNNALGDYVSPLIDLLMLTRHHDDDEEVNPAPQSDDQEPAMKIFPYLAYCLTGRGYPEGSDMPEPEAFKAKSDLYSFLFAEGAITWPREHGKLIRTRSASAEEPPFPYLRLILHFDAANFLSMLNEAFVDSFLNEAQEQLVNGSASLGDALNSIRTSISRQRIINILLGLTATSEFAVDQTIYTDMFIARNLAKFSFILLPGTTLHKILINLCQYSTDSLAEDCQLSVEYLLSVYHPADLPSLIPLFRQAKFNRVLKSTYKGSQQFAQWLEAHFEDPLDPMAVFDCIRECLKHGTRLNSRQLRDVRSIIVDHANDLAALDAKRSAVCLRSYAPELVPEVLDRLDNNSRARFVFLGEFLEPENHQVYNLPHLLDDFAAEYTEQYVQMMCSFRPGHVADYIATLKSGDLRLGEVIPAMEKSGVIDAAVLLLARDGVVQDAMARLLKHLRTLQTAIISLLSAVAESPDVANTHEAGKDLVEAIQKYIKLGIWLCQSQRSNLQPVKRPIRTRKQYTEVIEDDLSKEELLWLNLLDGVVKVSRAVATVTKDDDPSIYKDGQVANVDSIKTTAALRSLVQQAFTALLATTTNDINTIDEKAGSGRQDQSFLRIFRTFLDRVSRSHPSLSDLRSVLADIFSAYTFEESMLALSNSFLDKEVFVHVEESQAERKKGWKPRSQICEHCRKRAWGPGAGVEIWEAWKKKEERGEKRKLRQRIEKVSEEAARRMDRGKGRARSSSESDIGMRQSIGDDQTVGSVTPNPEDKGPLIIFACGHLYHRKCFGLAHAKARKSHVIGALTPGEYTCPLCPQVHNA